MSSETWATVVPDRISPDQPWADFGSRLRTPRVGELDESAAEVVDLLEDDAVALGGPLVEAASTSPSGHSWPADPTKPRAESFVGRTGPVLLVECSCSVGGGPERFVEMPAADVAAGVVPSCSMGHKGAVPRCERVMLPLARYPKGWFESRAGR